MCQIREKERERRDKGKHFKLEINSGGHKERERKIIELEDDEVKEIIGRLMKVIKVLVQVCESVNRQIVMVSRTADSKDLSCFQNYSYPPELDCSFINQFQLRREREVNQNTERERLVVSASCVLFIIVV